MATHDIVPAGKKGFSAAIAIGGTTLVDTPVVLWDITINNDTAAAVVCVVADIGTYATGSRTLVVSVPSHDTKHLVFPRGKKFTDGLSAAVNAGSVDVSYTYD